MEQYLLVIDQGTTSSRAVLYDTAARPVCMAQHPYAQYFPHPGWVEQQPQDLWGSVLASVRDVLERHRVAPGQIAAVGITNQRETTLAWERETGDTLCPAIVWQCRRTAPLCEKAAADGLGDHIYQVTGLVLDAYFSATKLAWILDNVPGARRMAEGGKLCFGTVDSFLLWRLTGGKRHVTDRTNASRTMLYDIERCAYDERLLKYFSIPASVLPEVLPSCAAFGTVTGIHPALDGAPIFGVAGDQQASLFGQACFSPGDVKNTYGTGCFMLMNTGSQRIRSNHRLLSTIAWDLGSGPVYALEGSVFQAGTVIQWMRDELGLISTAEQSEAAAAAATDPGVYLVPAFTGLGAPHWDMYARGTLVGLTRSTTKADIVRAGLCSIAYQSADLMAALQADAGVPIAALKADGGASENDYLMQFQADICGTKVLRGVNPETTAQGACYLAGLQAGIFSSPEQIAQNWSCQRAFAPGMQAAEREKLLAGWHRAVGRSLHWAEE